MSIDIYILKSVGRASVWHTERHGSVSQPGKQNILED